MQPKRAPRLSDLIRQSSNDRVRLPATPPKLLERTIQEPVLDREGQGVSAEAEDTATDDPLVGHHIQDDAATDYEQLEQWLARLYRNAAQGRFDAEGIFDDAATLAERRSLVDALFAETFRPREPADPLPRAALNTAIYALRLGAAIGYGQDALQEVAVAGLLHKVGLSKLPTDLILGSDKLDPTALASLREHPRLARDSIRALGRRFEAVAELVYQCHERIDGSGYPLGLREGKIDEHALVIGLAALFDALTHPRPYRQRLIPFAAVKEILEKERNRFPRPVLRQFFATFSGFPPFSYVRLSSNAIAQVVANDPAHPMRPTVVVIRDPAGRKPAERAMLRLVEHPLLHIVGPISESDVAGVVG